MPGRLCALPAIITAQSLIIATDDEWNERSAKFSISNSADFFKTGITNEACMGSGVSFASAGKERIEPSEGARDVLALMRQATSLTLIYTNVTPSGQSHNV